MFSFPPENFLTMLTPYIFGDLLYAPYWGRAYLWEMNLFIGINGILLAIYGWMKGGKSARPFAMSAIFLLVLALGAHTPLFHLLYNYVPGFDRFRGSSKWMYFASLCFIFLSGLGFDALLTKSPSEDVEGRQSLWKRALYGENFHLPILIAALLAACAALYLTFAAKGILPQTPWRLFLRWLAATGESYLNAGLYTMETFVGNTAMLAAIQWFIAALTLLITAWLWSLAQTRSKAAAAFGIFGLALLEVFLFARLSLISLDPQMAKHPPLEKFMTSLQKEDRILNLWKPNSALSFHTFDLWGYDPGIPRRYAELIAFTQGMDPRQASQYVHFRRYHPLLKMLRLRYIIVPGREHMEIQQLPPAMKRMHLVSHWQTASSADDILAIMGNPEFDPEKMVVLEKNPPISASACPSPGTVEVLSSTTDDVTMEAKLDCPAILLVTDNHSNGWRAESLDRSKKQPYEIIRANYTLMAIPLDSGIHRLKISYRPGTYPMGVLISCISLFLFGILSIVWLKGSHRYRGKRHLQDAIPY
jgi:hypothetical protein